MKTRIAILIPLITLFMILSRHMMVDDGLIYARFFQNAFDGRGLVFNPNETVNSLTSPFFSYVMLGTVWLLHGHVLFAEHLIFGLALFGACVVAESLVPYAGIAVATMAYFYSLMGMESSLFLLLIMLVAKAYTTRRYDWLPLLVILTVLTRFEGGLFLPIFAVLFWRERTFPRIASFIPAFLVAAAYLFINHHLYHAYLPHSASSKFGQALSGYWGRWPWSFLHVKLWAFTGIGAPFLYTAYTIPLIFYFGYKGWLRLRGDRLNSVIAPFWLGLSAFYILCNMPSYQWYYAPLIFLAVLYAIEGVPRNQRALNVLFAVLAITFATNIFVVKSMQPNWNYIAIANWINTNTSPDVSVESVEIGQIGWYTHRRVIDILGLTYPKNADHIAHHDATSWLNEDRPDFIVIHKPTAIWEEVAVGNPNYDQVPYHSGPVYLLRKKDAPWISSKPKP